MIHRRLNTQISENSKREGIIQNEKEKSDTNIKTKCCIPEYLFCGTTSSLTSSVIRQFIIIFFFWKVFRSWMV
ncbi:hypothetical protein DPEC_G00122830 [Dallia pectoralis]|uniref:Uncharacterized protein n=1 Tax=Dallia pectoralis TaxID=75939 RepID=A0ACC2GQM0_DALPE|nr:hypothetical protein DPEC_G00122830 [Dallia pectoralis]